MRETISYIGIDPGLTGGISVFAVDMIDKEVSGVTLVDSLRMPVLPSPRYKTKKSNRINVSEIEAVIQQYNITHGCIELVSAMPAQNAAGKTVQGASSTFTFGYGTGMTEAVLFLNNIELTWVTPSVWKKYFELIKKTKMDSVHKAESFWPLHGFKRLVDNGRAEAALIGCYGITKKLRGSNG